MLKVIYLVLGFLLAYPMYTLGQVAICYDGSDPDASAMLEVKCNDRGFLPPRMGVAERAAIADPAEGLMIYNTDTKAIEFFNGTMWITLTNGFVCGQQVQDTCGNVYNTIQIGEQCWMKENLLTQKYSDGSDIPLVTDNIAWAGLSTPAYCWYNNDSATYASLYGALYNWYAASSGNLCPSGWHVATQDEWISLEICLGMDAATAASFGTRGTDEGEQLKSISGWDSGGNGTDAVGFTALPGGARDDNGLFSGDGTQAWFWTATEGNSLAGYARRIFSSSSQINMGTYIKARGMSIRCIKD